VDAYTALAWCFPDEISEYADRVLVALESKTILVPAVWSLEVANALWPENAGNVWGCRTSGGLRHYSKACL
jgi:hypothetical protein